MQHCCLVPWTPLHWSVPPFSFPLCQHPCTLMVQRWIDEIEEEEGGGKLEMETFEEYTTHRIQRWPPIFPQRRIRYMQWPQVW